MTPSRTSPVSCKDESGPRTTCHQGRGRSVTKLELSLLAVSFINFSQRHFLTTYSTSFLGKAHTKRELVRFPVYLNFVHI